MRVLLAASLARAGPPGPARAGRLVAGEALAGALPLPADREAFLHQIALPLRLALVGTHGPLVPPRRAALARFAAEPDQPLAPGDYEPAGPILRRTVDAGAVIAVLRARDLPEDLHGPYGGPRGRGRVLLLTNCLGDEALRWLPDDPRGGPPSARIVSARDRVRVLALLRARAAQVPVARPWAAGR